MSLLRDPECAIMPLIPLRLLLDHAAETDSPVIVQASRRARSNSQGHYLRHLMLAAAELYPQIPIATHQDRHDHLGR